VCKRRRSIKAISHSWRWTTKKIKKIKREKGTHGVRISRDDMKKKENPEGVPILRYGINYDVFNVKEAMSRVALKSCGNLEKLAMNGVKYYTPNKPDFQNNNISVVSHGLNQAEYLEVMKEYGKIV
jgi:hypothetical protein